MNTQAVVDLTQSLGWIINQEKSELKPTQVFSFVGYEYHLDSALVKPTQERWLRPQDLILQLNSKHVLTARCLMSLIGLLASMEKMVPGGKSSHEALEISSVAGQPPSLDRNKFCTSAHLDWWFTPHVDLFATHLNHKLPLHVFSLPDPKAWDIDALNINWTGLTASLTLQRLSFTG